MDIRTEELPGKIAKVMLSGRLDSSGAVEIEMPLNAIATERRAIIVDLTSVAFLSSYGVRVLLVAAKICSGKGGKLILLCPDGHVAKVLRIARIDALVPMFDNQDAAVSTLAE
jgi:anti-sigma B factor antagonist